MTLKFNWNVHEINLHLRFNWDLCNQVLFFTWMDMDVNKTSKKILSVTLKKKYAKAIHKKNRCFPDPTIKITSHLKILCFIIVSIFLLQRYYFFSIFEKNKNCLPTYPGKRHLSELTGQKSENKMEIRVTTCNPFEWNI